MMTQGFKQEAVRVGTSVTNLSLQLIQHLQVAIRGTSSDMKTVFYTRPQGRSIKITCNLEFSWRQFLQVISIEKINNPV